MLTDWRVSEAWSAEGGPGVAAAERPPEVGESDPAGPLPFRLFEHEYGIPVEQEDKRIAVNS
jgi:hypothetical protein